MFKLGEPILYEKLSWDEAARFGKDPGMILITTGTIEQHGPHSSMDVDAAINYEICKRVSAKLGVPVFPQIMPGISQSHGFPGVVWVRPETFIDYLYDIVCSLITESSFRQIFILNGHMWNQGAVLSVRDMIRCEFKDVQIKVQNWWAFDQDVYRLASSDCPLGRSLHANIGETSAMLAIDPKHMDMEKAKRLKVDNPEFEHFWDYREEQLTTSGVMGAAATQSTAELGEQIIALAAQKIIYQLQPAMTEKPRYSRRQIHPEIGI